MGKRSQRVGLVIDASVLQAAGEGPAESARRCRHFLEAVLEVCHHAQASTVLADEWKRHRSGFSRRWLRWMFSRKKVRIEPVAAMARDAIEAVGFTEHELQLVLDDLHLVERALQGDGRVVSLDETSRALFARAAGSIAALRSLIWVNPIRPEDGALEWIREKCPSQPHRALGRYATG
jgi:hypothetical protein